MAHAQLVAFVEAALKAFSNVDYIARRLLAHDTGSMSFGTSARVSLIASCNRRPRQGSYRMVPFNVN